MAPKSIAAFGDLLREHRVAAGLTQEQLAERAGLSVYGIQKLERGTTHPYRDTANRLVEALHLESDEETRFRAAVRPVRRHGSMRSGHASPSALQSALIASLLTGGQSESDGELRHSRGLIGRQHEQAALIEMLDAVALGHGAVALVSGEPGIGKTRLIMELAEKAQNRGWRVLLGRAYESEGSLPFLPFVESLRGHLQTCSMDEARVVLARVPPSLAGLIPEALNRNQGSVTATPPNQPDGTPWNPERERYQLFEAICSLFFDIARLAAPCGLLLTLEDLHWADAATLQLLLHLARRLAGSPVLVVASHRTVGLDQSTPFTDLLAELSRESLARRFSLSALTRDNVSSLVEGLSGTLPAPAVVDAVYQQTNGNPFFAGEVVRHLQEQGRDLSDPTIVAEEWTVPDGVHRVIGRRTSRLSDLARQLLQAGAVLGEPFGFNVL